SEPVQSRVYFILEPNHLLPIRITQLSIRRPESGTHAESGNRGRLRSRIESRWLWSNLVPAVAGLVQTLACFTSSDICCKVISLSGVQDPLLKQLACKQANAPPVATMDVTSGGVV